MGFIPALLCAEADPMVFHRFSMISVALKNDFQVLHILKDKRIVENAALEKMVLKKFRQKNSSPTLFEEELQLKTAYRLMNDRIGYKLG